MNRAPKDYDITTNANPEEIQQVFSGDYRVVYENRFGTVGLVDEGELQDSPFRTIEVTPYREESDYSNHRHPDMVSFSKNLSDDLSRRDFTVNALAYDDSKGHLIDLYDGIKDILSNTLTSVGNAEKRLSEDALRMLRAVRFSAELSFTCNNELRSAIANQKELLNNVSRERIRDEFVKIVMSDSPMAGLMLAHDLGILQYVSREIEEGIGVEQSRSHKYDVWEHNLRACQNAADQKWPFHVRLSALFHDIGKPRTRRWDAVQKIYTFYGHEVVGAKIVKDIMERLHFSKEQASTVVSLVRYHMFFSDTDAVTLSSVRRLVKNIGSHLIWDLMNVRRSDRIGMGRPVAAPYRLRKFEAMIDEACRSPLTVGMLNINGDIIMLELGLPAGRRLGYILHALLEEVLEDSSLNTREYLMKRTLELSILTDDELRERAEAGKNKRDEIEDSEIQQIRKRHKVD